MVVIFETKHFVNQEATIDIFTTLKTSDVIFDLHSLIVLQVTLGVRWMALLKLFAKTNHKAQHRIRILVLVQFVICLFQ
jgi:hypothetical protein